MSTGASHDVGRKIYYTTLPRWVTRLVPQHLTPALYAALAILGAKAIATAAAPKPLWGQVIVHQRDTARIIRIPLTQEQYTEIVTTLSNVICSNRITTILRTAIFVGMNLKGARTGAPHPTRLRRLRQSEALKIMATMGIDPPQNKWPKEQKSGASNSRLRWKTAAPLSSRHV